MLLKCFNEEEIGYIISIYNTNCAIKILFDNIILYLSFKFTIQIVLLKLGEQLDFARRSINLQYKLCY